MTSTLKIIPNHRVTTPEDPDRETELQPQPRDTPRHPDLAVILPGRSGPVRKIERQAPNAARVAARRPVAGTVR